MPLLRLAPFALVLLPTLSKAWFYFHYEQGWRPQWRQAARVVERHRSDRDLVAVANAAPMDWYLNPITPAHRPRSPQELINLEWWDLEEKVDRLLRDREAPQIWVVVNRPLFLEKDPGGRQLARLMAS